MSKVISPLLSKMNQLISEKKKVDEDIQYLDIVILYWDDFIKKIEQIKIDDVPPVQMGYLDPIKNIDYDYPVRNRVIQDFNNIAFELRVVIKNLKKRDDKISYRAAIKLQRMLNNFTGNSLSNKKYISVKLEGLPKMHLVEPKEKYIDINFNSFPKMALYRVFYNFNGVHLGLKKVVEAMYNAFPETNIKDIDAVKVEKEKKSNQLYEEIIKIQSMITLQGGTFNLDTPPNISDAGKAAQQTNQAAEPFVITPIQKIMIGTAILLLISGIAVTLVKSNQK